MVSLQDIDEKKPALRPETAKHSLLTIENTKPAPLKKEQPPSAGSVKPKKANKKATKQEV